MTTQQRPFNLSDRQVQILEALADGLSNAEIGARLWIVSDSVRSHLRRMSKQMGCGDRAGMVALGFRAGVLRLPDEMVVAQAEEIRLREQERYVAKVRTDLARQAAARGAA
jgi:DNA-binding CsgD family transcriptional regulator